MLRVSILAGYLIPFRVTGKKVVLNFKGEVRPQFWFLKPFELSRPLGHM
jgi:hypothetical protein